MPHIIKQALAEQDLVDIWLYSWKEWGEYQADQYLDALEQVFNLLVEQPLLGRERKEFTPLVRTHVHSQHIIVYQSIQNGIRLIRVLHKSMDIETQLNL